MTSGVLIRNGSKLRFDRVPFHRYSILDYRVVSREATIIENQQFRAYAGFPHVFGKLKDSVISRSQCSRSLSSSSSPFPSRNGFVGWYLSVIKSHPILTKSVTSAVIYTASDFTSQGLTLKSSEPFDLIRTLRVAGCGMLIVGPSLHYWFNFVSRVLPKRDMLTTVKKIFMGQLILGPAINAAFFSVNARLQGENGSAILARLKRDLLPTLKNGLIYWPMCDFVTFKFIPIHLQPLMNNAFAYLWTIYLTYMASLQKVDNGNALAV